jgi:paraquat-inducible protein B
VRVGEGATPWRRAGAWAMAAWLVATASAAAAEPSSLAQLSLDRLVPGSARERPVAPAVPEGGVPFSIRFAGAARGLEPGAAVEINGVRIGAVRGVALQYEAAARRFVVATEILLQPERLPPVEGRRAGTPEDTVAAIDALVGAGLRARLASARPLGGETIVVLAMVPEAPAATLGRGAGLPEIPAAPSRAEEAADRLQDLMERLSRAPVEQMVADLQEAMAALKALATGPELRDALAGLGDGAAELRAQVSRLGARADPMLNSLNETVRTANRTLGSLDRQLGERSPLLTELHGLLRELSGAARSLRLMADYLERNPDALIRGKSDNRR